MVNRYSKGARGERELIHKFSDAGFSVIRAAGSGVNSLSPDLLVFKRGRQYAFESKAWGGNRVSIPREQFEGLQKWEENTGITTMIAWKIDRMGWFFFYLKEMKENPAGFSMTKKRALEVNRGLGYLLESF